MASEGVQQGNSDLTGSEIADASQKKEDLRSMKEFFERRAPGAFEKVIGSGKDVSTSTGYKVVPEFPVLTLHCPDAQCGTPRPFDYKGGEIYLPKNAPTTLFVPYRCRTCQRASKTYAMRCSAYSSTQYGMFKFGEDFPFGEPIPRGVLDLLGDQKAEFLKGRAAENRDLGLGAFAYYRRVVESQSKDIFGAILRAAETLGADKETLTELRAASTERQFSKAVESLRHGIPDALRVDGHDPLTLLHDALSEGLHAQTDEECLQLAQAVRVVLTSLVQRVSEVTRQDSDLKAAVSQLLEKKRARKANAK